MVECTWSRPTLLSNTTLIPHNITISTTIPPYIGWSGYTPYFHTPSTQHGPQTQTATYTVDAAMEAGGAHVSVLAAEERQRWAQSLPDIAGDWARAQDEQGLDGTGVVNTYMQELKDAGVLLPRDWTVE